MTLVLASVTQTKANEQEPEQFAQTTVMDENETSSLDESNLQSLLYNVRYNTAYKIFLLPIT